MKLQAISEAMEDAGAVVTHRRRRPYTDMEAHEEERHHERP